MYSSDRLKRKSHTVGIFIDSVSTSIRNSKWYRGEAQRFYLLTYNVWFLFLFKISGNFYHIRCFKGTSQSLLCFVFNGVSFEFFFWPCSRAPCPKNKLHCLLHTTLLSLHVKVTFIFQELYLIWNINWTDDLRDNVYMILDIPVRKQVILIAEVT